MFSINTKYLDCNQRILFFLQIAFDRSEIMVYEEVARMPPFQRKTLVLVGAPGVGRRTLKQRLIKADQSRFGSATPRKMIIYLARNTLHPQIAIY